VIIERLTDTQELIRRDVGLLQNSPQRTLGKITRVIRYCGIQPFVRIEPDFVTASSLPVEYEAEAPQTSHDLTVAKLG
jgi:hypothetical protein